MIFPSPRPWKSHQGVGLIEVMIALFVTGIGLLGLAALQGKAQRAELESYQRTQALMLLQDMASRIRANRTEALQSGSPYLAEVGQGVVSEDLENACQNPDEYSQAQIDLSCWHIALRGELEQITGSDANNPDFSGGMIGGHGCITQDSDPNQFKVTVVWQGLTEVTQAFNDPCGKEIIQDNFRRAISIPIHFAEF